METLLRDPVLAQGEEFFRSFLAANTVTHGKGPYQTSPALEVRNVHGRDSGRYPSRSTI